MVIALQVVLDDCLHALMLICRPMEHNLAACFLAMPLPTIIDCLTGSTLSLTTSLEEVLCCPIGNVMKSYYWSPRRTPQSWYFLSSKVVISDTSRGTADRHVLLTVSSN